MIWCQVRTFDIPVFWCWGTKDVNTLGCKAEKKKKFGLHYGQKGCSWKWFASGDMNETRAACLAALISCWNYSASWNSTPRPT
jgi:hypothetical protein